MYQMARHNPRFGRAQGRGALASQGMNDMMLASGGQSRDLAIQTMGRARPPAPPPGSRSPAPPPVPPPVPPPMAPRGMGQQAMQFPQQGQPSGYGMGAMDPRGQTMGIGAMYPGYSQQSPANESILDSMKRFFARYQGR